MWGSEERAALEEQGAVDICGPDERLHFWKRSHATPIITYSWHGEYAFK